MLLSVLDEKECVTGVVYPVLDILDEPIGLSCFFISHDQFGALLDQFTITHDGVVESFALLNCRRKSSRVRKVSTRNLLEFNPLTLPHPATWPMVCTQCAQFYLNESPLKLKPIGHGKS